MGFEGEVDHGECLALDEVPPGGEGRSGASAGRCPRPAKTRARNGPAKRSIAATGVDVGADVPAPLAALDEREADGAAREQDAAAEGVDQLGMAAVLGHQAADQRHVGGAVVGEAALDRLPQLRPGVAQVGHGEHGQPSGDDRRDERGLVGDSGGRSPACRRPRRRRPPPCSSPRTRAPSRSASVAASIAWSIAGSMVRGTRDNVTLRSRYGTASSMPAPAPPSRRTRARSAAAAATSSAPASATAAAAVRPIPSASVNARPAVVGELLPGRAAERAGDRVRGADRLVRERRRARPCRPRTRCR